MIGLAVGEIVELISFIIFLSIISDATKYYAEDDCIYICFQLYSC
jgi:hypothetical protein